ncbi:2Fe-2S ferredoxin [Litorimonas taeanensis]|uniref:2Fe-2S ferredoxin n=1 Tax=Litorimonas taeanensis TaxID=568099 RepID=A0A420WJU9_9PROT|nr:2Fe-2S iron-sulfur cluster-binding protein [Litorimonas taeanensis]RKQ71175.1 2Fe-2S ferredoxin [Litorimonas taeanensis]
MPKILFMSHAGEEHSIEAKVGDSLMEAAVKNSIAGIDADCGGACACATCHVYIDSSYSALTGTPDDMEQSMLDFADEVQPTSRLSCQIPITEEMEGIVVRLPESQ